MGKLNKILVAHNFIERYEKYANEAYKAEQLYWHMSQSVWRTGEHIKLLNDIIHYAENANAIYDCAFMVGIKGLVDILTDIETRLQKSYDSTHDIDGLIGLAHHHFTTFGDYKKVDAEHRERIARLEQEVKDLKGV